MSTNTPFLDFIKEKRTDAITWQVDQWMRDVEGPHEKAKAIDQIAVLIDKISSKTLQEAYIDFIVKNKKYGIKLKQLQDVISNRANFFQEKDDDDMTELDKLPAWMNKDEVEMKGFCEVKTQDRVGYYGWGPTGKMEISNFIIYPVFHVRGEAEDSRHIFEVQNRVKKVLLDVPSKVFISLETLLTHLVAKGSYLFYGSKPQLLRIASELLPKFPLCDEIKHLGWQREGFFAFVNKVYVPGKEIMDISRWGVVDVNDHHFLIPAASEVYNNYREGDDLFKNIRVLSYTKSKISFSDWAKQMYTVYGNKGLTGASYALLTIFRDIIFDINHNCPHLYGYGERSSGKSQWALSISSLFYRDRPAFNVNSGTDFAFFNYMQSFVNCPAHLNEVDDKVLREEWFQAIKGIFDGEARMRGRMGSRTQIEMQHVESTLILTGQYISTKDDNSLVSRSLVEAFAEKTYTDEEKAEFDKLSKWQKEGLTSIVCDILQHRSTVKEQYYDRYNEIVSIWRRSTTGEFNQRIFQNWAHLSAMWFIFGKIFDLPVGFVEFDTMAYGKAVEYSRFIRSSDTLTDFWHTVSFLLDQNLITAGWDFKITTQTSIKLRSGDGKEYEQQWEQPRKILMIRLNNVHKLYQQAKSKSGGKDIMTLENLKHYFSSRPYFIGQVKQTQFKRLVYRPLEERIPGNELTPATTNVRTVGVPESTITSAYIFDYDVLGCELERSNPDIDGEYNES